MTKPRMWSASQASTYLDCPRKWAFDKIDKRPREETDSQRLGSAVHKHLEGLLERGAWSVDSDMAEKSALIAHAMRPHLPTAPVLGIERYLKRGNWLGYVDLLYEADPVGVSDHKTTSNIGKWALTSKKLAENIQATIYVFLVAGSYELDPGARVPLWWTYGQTQGANKARAVRSSLLVAEAERRVAWLDQNVVAPGNALHAAQTPARLVEPNPLACGKFGGCAHRDVCELTTTQKLMALGRKDETTMGWQKRFDENPTLFEKTGAAPAPAEPFVYGGAPVPTAPGPVQAAPGPVQAAPGPVGGLGGPYEDVNRPSTPPVQVAPALPVQAAPALPALPAQAAQVQVAPVLPPPALPAPAPIQPVLPPPVQAALVQATPETSTPDQETTPGTGFTLLIDCFEQGAMLVSQLVQVAHGQLCAKHGLAHYKNVPEGHPLAFGKASGVLVTHVMQLLEAKATPDLVLQVSTAADETGLIIGELEARAGRVIRGAR